MIKSTTIKDIADALGLSYSTVSRALKDSYKISKETKDKVKAYATAHHYRPNLAAQCLRNKQSRIIGVILNSISDAFFAEVVNGIETVASERDYHIIIAQSRESYQREIKSMAGLKWRSVDGVLISLSAETEHDGHFKEMNENGIPIVFFDKVPISVNIHKVVSDNCAGSYNITSHLIQAGYHRIAFLTGSHNLSATQERLEGYHKALAEHNIALKENYIRYCPHGGMRSGEIENALDELLNLRTPPDALITASDRLTIACYLLLKKKGISIPQQIAVAGFSNFRSPELFSPSLTTIVEPAFDIGKTATELLLQIIESKRPVKDFVKKILPTELFIRDSTKRVNKKKSK